VEGKVMDRLLHVSQQELPGIAAEHQFRTIGDAARIVEPGDTVLIHTGVYRETVVIEGSGSARRPITFTAAPAANVMVTGADRVTGWTKAEGPHHIFFIPWTHVFIPDKPSRAHPDDDAHLLIGRCEQVIVSNYLLRQVLRREELARGTFFVDEPNQRLYAWADNDADLNKTPAEVSVRGTLWDSRGRHVHTRGIRFRYAANVAQHGAAHFHDYAVVEDCIFERMNSGGADLFDPCVGVTVRRCTFQDNGQQGFTTDRSHKLRMTDCLVRNNNTKNFQRSWEAGGNKIWMSDGVIVEKCQFAENRGEGLWFDCSNTNATVRNCLFAFNESAGLFYEISYGLHAHDNVFVGNGCYQEATRDAACGLLLSESPDCVIERNLFIGNRDGISFREHPRSTNSLDEKGKSVWIWSHDVTVCNNIMAYNSEAQTWGFFAVSDQRHLPQAMQDPTTIGNPAKELWDRYQESADGEFPTGLSLEKLNISLRDNFYAVADDQEIFHWGAPQVRNKRYPNLDEVRGELGLEQGSVVGEFQFRDYLTLDFRVPVDSPVLKMGCYPKGKVPGVRLGILRAR
jgi:hypothetical protein